LVLWKDNLSKYKSVPLTSSTRQQLCDGAFCCDFNVEMSSVDPTTKYRLVAFDSFKAYQEPFIAGLRVCGVVICRNDTVESCVELIESETNFSSITINASYPNYEDILVFPIAFGTDLYPLQNYTYNERYENKRVHITATLSKPTKNLVTCGLYTRDFSKDFRLAPGATIHL